MPKRRNVVIIISDQHKRSAAGCYGNGYVRTPGIDRLAVSGTLFDQAYCSSPLCAPSRASFITGTYPHTNGALYHTEIVNGETVPAGFHRQPGYAEELTTIGELFRSNGYATGAIGKMHVHGETREFDMGFTERAHRFYTYKFADYVASVGEEKKNAYVAAGQFKGSGQYNLDGAAVPLVRLGEMQDDLTLASSLDFIERHQADPFLLHVGLEKPHPPWTETAEAMAAYDPKALPDSHLPATRHEALHSHSLAWQHPASVSDEQIRTSVSAYYANVTSMDAKVGAIVDKIEELGLRDNTLIVYTSDHGELCWEHGLIEKHGMYEASVGIPLVLSLPGVVPNERRVAEPVTIIDLMPTLARVAGLSGPEQCEGTDLLPTLRGERLSRDVIFSEFFNENFVDSPGRMIPQRMVRTREWKYVYTHGRNDQLYAVGSEERPEDNAAADRPDVVSQLKRYALAGWSTSGRLAAGRNVEELLEGSHIAASVERGGAGTRLVWSASPSGVTHYQIYGSARPFPVSAELVSTVPASVTQTELNSELYRYAWIVGTAGDTTVAASATLDCQGYDTITREVQQQ